MRTKYRRAVPLTLEVTQSVGGSNVIRPDRVNPKVPSARVGRVFQVVGFPWLSTAVAYSSVPDQPLLATLLKSKFISRNISGLPMTTDCPMDPNGTTPSIA